MIIDKSWSWGELEQKNHLSKIVERGDWRFRRDYDCTLD